MKFQNLIILPFLIPLFGFVEILSKTEDKFIPPTGTLKSYQIQVLKKRFRMQGESLDRANYMTDLRIIMKTASLASIQNYGVVQFIKGCKWQSHWDGKELTKELSLQRDHFGQSITFKHQDWEVDSDSHDPVYHSFRGDRFGLWRWNSNANSFDPETATFLYRKAAPHPTVFFTDLPGTSFKQSDQSAINSTLDFKTCIFKLTDIPEQTDPRGSNIDLSKSLKCFEWSDHFVYDFKALKMSQPTDIDPVCR